MKPRGQFAFLSDPLTIDTYHEPGVLVAKPARKLSCWAVVGEHRGQRVPKPYACRMRHRGAFLTCHAHRGREADAARLRAEIDAQAAHDLDPTTFVGDGSSVGLSVLCTAEIGSRQSARTRERK